MEVYCEIMVEASCGSSAGGSAWLGMRLQAVLPDWYDRLGLQYGHDDLQLTAGCIEY
jgi:hypothetical protein